MAIGQFDFDDYAEQNPDLRAAFGIDDEFRVANGTNGMTLDGLGGSDSVVFEGHSDGMTLRNIEEVIIDGSGTRGFESLQLLDQITINAVSQVVAKFADTAVAGSNDELNLTLNANIYFVTNGIETLNITLGSDADAVSFLRADLAQGKLLTINLAGGAEAGVSIGEFNTLNSVALTS